MSRHGNRGPVKQISAKEILAAATPVVAPPAPVVSMAPYDPGPIAVTYPDPAVVPDWTESTLILLAGLTPLERAVVEWVATGCSAADAYRRATKRETDTAKQNAYDIRHRPTVAAAIQSALKDRNVGARCDREWKLAKLQAAIAKCEASDHPLAPGTLGKLVKTMAELQGEITQKSEVQHNGLPERVDVHLRVDSMLAEVARLISGRTGRTPIGIGGAGRTVEAERVDDPVDAKRGATGSGVPK